ncbi:response regulator transcription factor [Schumannella sp. 10F1B-5-1]|uniref:response regulator transcription factor n=1 Tax=Schumannella sp. 10F1B-5-1 TaxID=2590780 RepID=UPI001130D3E1|nr:response regulator transcription factor [Schumannella sp. 10F1B-5-1]TPW76871.1 response regulator transcription factor [Schumannella sp. 10F1B-5-1]
MRVLIGEDDPSMSAALVRALSSAGHSCTRVTRGDQVLLRHRDADVVLLDLGLEDGDGLDVLTRLREVGETPVLVVTARGDERSTVEALSRGADDYLVKPVRMRELLARIAVVTRRRGRDDEPEVVVALGLRIDLAAHRVLCDDVEVALTPTEFAVLRALATQTGRAVARQRIIDEVWGGAYASVSRTFDVHLAQLRRKLPAARITTVRGYGYRLEPAP